MDPLGAALCGLGAATLVVGGASSAAGTLLLFAGFYGVHRTLRTGLSKALVAAPAAIWTLGYLWEFLPDSLVERIAPPASLLRSAPQNLGATVLVVALGLMVIGGRGRLGAALTTMALAALGIALLFRGVPTTWLEVKPGPLPILILATERGWGPVAFVLAGTCMFLIGIGPIPVQPLPRRGGAIAGAFGALLLCAGIAGVRQRISHEDALVVLGLVWLVANVLVAVGLGAMARAGAKLAGWMGLGLVVLGVVGIVPALALFQRAENIGYGFAMSTPFGLLGIGIAILGWRDAPLETARKVLGGLFVTAFAGGALAWFATFIALARLVDAREPWSLARITTEPLATYGLVLWATLLLHLATPPGVAQVQAAPGMPMPMPGTPPHGPPPGPPPGWGPPGAGQGWGPR